jgi:ankyrin repeat protein
LLSLAKRKAHNLAGLIERKIMACGKVALFVLMLVVLVLTGCGRGARKDVTQKAQDDRVCLKRADLKLIAAALNRNTPTMDAAIKSGADVNVTVEGLGPPIVVTALGDNYSGVQLLLDRGANINAEDSEGYTALINASFSNSPDIVRLLLSKGANVNAPSNLMVNGKKAGFTPMMIAKFKGHQEIVKLLTEAGAKK